MQDQTDKQAGTLRAQGRTDRQAGALREQDRTDEQAGALRGQYQADEQAGALECNGRVQGKRAKDKTEERGEKDEEQMMSCQMRKFGRKAEIGTMGRDAGREGDF